MPLAKKVASPPPKPPKPTKAQRDGDIRKYFKKMPKEPKVEKTPKGTKEPKVKKKPQVKKVKIPRHIIQALRWR